MKYLYVTQSKDGRYHATEEFCEECEGQIVAVQYMAGQDKTHVYGQGLLEYFARHYPPTSRDIEEINVAEGQTLVAVRPV